MADFDRIYGQLLARWPEGTRELDLPTPYGPTRVHAYGPADGAPLVLLPGGGATGLVWYANAPALGERYRVYAPDLLGDAGRTVRRGRELRRVGDLTGWLGAVLDALELPRVRLCGHSYGAWLAGHFALHAPERVERLVLIDPTQVFGGFHPGYLLRALPMLARPSEARGRAFLAWETRGAAVDETWQRLFALAATVPGRRLLAGPRLRTEGLRVPTLVLPAGRSRVHDAGRLAARARRALPGAEVEILPDATHHTLPLTDPGPLDARLLEFLA